MGYPVGLAVFRAAAGPGDGGAAAGLLGQDGQHLWRHAGEHAGWQVGQQRRRDQTGSNTGREIVGARLADESHLRLLSSMIPL